MIYTYTCTHIYIYIDADFTHQNVDVLQNFHGWSCEKVWWQIDQNLDRRWWELKFVENSPKFVICTKMNGLMQGTIITMEIGGGLIQQNNMSLNQ